jgi:peptide/nickel transport system substrate-binding protein
VRAWAAGSDMALSRRPRRAARGILARVIRGVLAGGCLIAVASCGSASSGPVSSLPTNGNTATWAELPGFIPNFIFPFTTPEDYGTWNMNQFQVLMYRPLYWFGADESPTVDDNLSLAGPPAWSADSKTVTITLKPYKWSDGETVDAADVLFWMNLEFTEKDNFGGYVPGYFPDNVASVQALSRTQVRFNLKSAYNHNWFLYNELSQITPLPAAWDRSASGPSNCAGTANDCPAVYNYLIAQNQDLAGYATSRIWSVVDGPWRLSAFNPDGALTMVPNPSYSGPVKPKLAEFKEAPFTSEAAEYNTLRDGTGTVQVGDIEPTYLTSPTRNPMTAGPNPLAPDYTLQPWTIYSINYFPMNFNNPTVGPIFRQLYFRQALQYTVDQEGMIRYVYHGYAYPTTNGVPTLPRSLVLSPGARNDPYPFSIGKAKALLSAHGWDVSTDPGTCVRPGSGVGECGAGISKGQQLSFDVKYANGTSYLPPIMQALQSDAGLAGIQLNLSQQAGQQITANDISCTPAPGTPCDWQMGNWGAGWVFDPDYYPTGEELFLTGSVANYGSYSNKHDDAMISATISPHATLRTLYGWESYIAKQVPVVWMPDLDYPILEVAANLKGVAPLNVFQNINPEDWYYVK